jgi:hypothetical protein
MRECTGTLHVPVPTIQPAYAEEVGGGVFILKTFENVVSIVDEKEDLLSIVDDFLLAQAIFENFVELIDTHDERTLERGKTKCKSQMRASIV